MEKRIELERRGKSPSQVSPLIKHHSKQPRLHKQNNDFKILLGVELHRIFASSFQINRCFKCNLWWKVWFSLEDSWLNWGILELFWLELIRKTWKAAILLFISSISSLISLYSPRNSKKIFSTIHRIFLWKLLSIWKHRFSLKYTIHPELITQFHHTNSRNYLAIRSIGQKVSLFKFVDFIMIKIIYCISLEVHPEQMILSD